MDGHIFIQRKGDIEQINNYKKYLDNKTTNELIATYNKSYNLGFVGVHQQAIFILALHYQFRKRFNNNTPVKIEDNVLISFKGKIKTITNDKIYYERH
jgi:hypothetical protein